MTQLEATAADDEKLERMFGCDPKAFLEDLRAPIARVGLTMVLMSLMSDVQEMVAANRSEDARQALNRLKYLVSETMPSTSGAPADVSVSAELADLRALHSTTTDGAWQILPGRALAISGTVSNTGYQGFDVLRGHGRNAKEAKSNAAFSAKMHRAAIPLLEAAALVEHVLVQQSKLPPDSRDAYTVATSHEVLTNLKQSLA